MDDTKIAIAEDGVERIWHAARVDPAARPEDQGLVRAEGAAAYHPSAAVSERGGPDHPVGQDPARPDERSFSGSLPHRGFDGRPTWALATPSYPFVLGGVRDAKEKWGPSLSLSRVR